MTDARIIEPEEITPDEHGNSYITFGDGTGAVHTEQGWVYVVEQDDSYYRARK